VQPVTHGVNTVVDYAMKTLKRGNVDYDTAIILPRTYDEMRSSRMSSDPHKLAIKNIQSAMNVSDQVAEQIYRNAAGK
jgi:hypothetical protein